MNITKISTEAMNAVGAKTPAEYDAKLVSLLTANAALAEKFTALETDFKALKKTADENATGLETAAKTIEAQAKEITTLKADAGKPNEAMTAEIKNIATTAARAAGSHEAVKALGETGSTVAAAPSTAAGTGAQSPVANLIAAGKFDEAFAADKNVQAEFITKEAYAAYMRAHAKGQVKAQAGRH